MSFYWPGEAKRVFFTGPVSKTLSNASSPTACVDLMSGLVKTAKFRVLAKSRVLSNFRV